MASLAMVTSPVTILGLADAGAHATQIMDASQPTYFLSHWVRDRGVVSVEEGVRRLTSDTASFIGYRDRGVIAEGMKADLNVIDLGAMHLHAPDMVFDLPAGGRRLVQRVDGYVATVQTGDVTFENGEPTGARPGKVVRA